MGSQTEDQKTIRPGLASSSALAAASSQLRIFLAHHLTNATAETVIAVSCSWEMATSADDPSPRTNCGYLIENPLSSRSSKLKAPLSTESPIESPTSLNCL